MEKTITDRLNHNSLQAKALRGKLERYAGSKKHSCKKASFNDLKQTDVIKSSICKGFLSLAFLFLTSVSFYPLTTFAQVGSEEGVPFIENYRTQDFGLGPDVYELWCDDAGRIYVNGGSRRGYAYSDGNTWRAFRPFPESERFRLGNSAPGHAFTALTFSPRAYARLKPLSSGRLMLDSIPLSKISDPSRYVASLNLHDSILVETDDRYGVFISQITSDSQSFLLDYFDSSAVLRPVRAKRGEFFFQVEDSLFTYEKNGHRELILRSSHLKKVAGYTIFELSENRFLMVFFVQESQTNRREQHFLSFIKNDSNSVKEIIPNYDGLLYGRSAGSFGQFLMVNDNCIAVSTQKEGLLLMDSLGRLIRHIDQTDGLADDYVLGMELDKQKNIWLATTNGLSKVSTALPFSIWSRAYGLEGTPTDFQRIDGKIYVATASGLYVFENARFKEVKGGQFEVWTLNEHRGRLIVGGSGGIYLMNEEGELEPVLREAKVMHLEKLSENMFAGMTFDSRTFYFGFNESQQKWEKPSVNAEIRNTGRSFGRVFKDKNAIYTLKLTGNDSLIMVRLRAEHDYFDGVSLVAESEQSFDLEVKEFQKGLPQKARRKFIYGIKGKPCIATEKGYFRFDAESESFFEDERLDILPFKAGAIFQLQESRDGRLWVYAENKGDKYFDILIPGEGNNYLRDEQTLKFLTNFSIEWMPVTFEGDSVAWFGTPEGLIRYDIKADFSIKNADFRCLISRVSYADSVIFHGFFPSEALPYSLISEQPSDAVFSFESGRFIFEYAAPFFIKEENTEYRYRLLVDGKPEKWSSWSKEGKVEFARLAPGDYRFEVQAKNVFGTLGQPASYEFIIQTPWYAHSWLFLVYILLIVGFVYGVVRLNTVRLRRERDRLELIIGERTKEISNKNVALQKSKEEVESIAENLRSVNRIVTEKNENILAGINYAKRIQDALLPAEVRIQNAFGAAFIFFRPRDIVSGDFYWFAEKNGLKVIVAADCTGHGVPGAFMSMLGMQALSDIVNDKNILSPEKILNELDKQITELLQKQETKNRDGMDACVLVYAEHEQKVRFSGAKNPLYIVKGGNLVTVKGDRSGIGELKKEKTSADFTLHEFDLDTEPQSFFIASDGYQDQFGGTKNRKFMRKQFRDLLAEIADLDHDAAAEVLSHRLDEWITEGESSQIDDILVIGLKLCLK